MFIENKEYKTPVLNTVTTIRNLLFNSFYTSQEVIDSLRNIIRHYIDCDDIIFDTTNYSFLIKSRSPMFKEWWKPELYYSTMHSIYKDFFTAYRSELMLALYGYYNDYSQVYSILDSISNESILCTLCNLTIIDRNLICIKL